MEHNINGDIMFQNTSPYKGFNITSKSRIERMRKGVDNPYGYNLEETSKDVVNYEYKATHTNQDFVKNKEYLGKR